MAKKINCNPKNCKPNCKPTCKPEQRSRARFALTLCALFVIIGGGILATHAWTDPGTLGYTIQNGIPTGNVSSPLNSGSIAQGKLGNLGLGTLTPGTTLDILGSGFNQVNVAGNNPAQSGGVYIGSSTGQILSVEVIGSTTAGGNNNNAILYGRGGLGNIEIGSSRGAPQTVFNLATGNVGIGTTTPGTYKLYVNGTGFINASAWTYASDARLKENINDISSGLSIIQQLRPVTFDYIAGEKNQAGFIAQDVERILPNIVSTGSDGMLGIKTDSIIPYLVKAIQDQQKEINDLNAQIEILKNK